MNLFLIVITGIILVSFFTSTEILAQNSVTSQYRGLNTDQAVYSLERHEIAYVKISGVGPDTNVRERVSIIITLPDSTKSNHSVFSSKDGYFELILPIPYESLGNYKVFASMSGKILGDIYFSIEEKIKENTIKFSPSVSSPNISSLITIRTDSPSSPIKQSNSTFKIPSKMDTAPKITPTAPKVDPVPSVSKDILKSTIPINNIVKSTLNKITPIDYSGKITGIVFFAFIFLVVVLLIHRKFKKHTKNHNPEEEKRRKEHEWNKKRSEDHHRRQEEERQRWEREKYNRQYQEQKQHKKQKQHKEQKQYTESNKTEFTVTESLDILNVQSDATPETIKKARRDMVLKYHPDKHKSAIQRRHAEIMMKNINIAYEALQRANRV